MRKPFRGSYHRKDDDKATRCSNWERLSDDRLTIRSVDRMGFLTKNFSEALLTVFIGIAHNSLITAHFRFVKRCKTSSVPTKSTQGIGR